MGLEAIHFYHAHTDCVRLAQAWAVGRSLARQKRFMTLFPSMGKFAQILGSLAKA